jgi:Integrase core domain
LALHPINLPRAVNASLQARISGGRINQSGRLLPVDPLRTGHSAGIDSVNLGDGPQLALMDNAPIESFFHTLKTELVMHCDYHTRIQARSSLFDFMEVFYNRARRHSSINYESPLAFEHQQSPN